MESLRSLAGQNVILRPLVLDDFEALYRAASDPLIWEQHPEPTRFRRDVFEKFFQSAVDGRLAYVILDALTSEIIGSSRYRLVEDEPQSIEIGWTFLVRQYWGGPTNREVKSLMLRYAFESFETVIFTIGETNFRSRRAVEKLGATLRDGAHEGKVTYALSKYDFERG